MGTSNWQNISYCVGTLRRLMPTSVLDVGTGFGRWGLLCREFLDVWEGREARALWRVRIDGIEAFPSCLTPVHGYIYDRVHVGDAVDLLPTLGTYDVVYLGDVVEHQTKARAWSLVDAAVRHARQAAIVTIPIGENWPQEVGADGNWYHAHRSTWTLEDFDRFPGATRQAFSDYHGRMYLVVELPGQADAAADPLAPIHVSASQLMPHASGATGVASDVLARLDRNLACHGLVDDDRVRSDVSGTLLFQLPAAADVRRRLDQLESEGLPWVPPFAGMVDALFRHLVDREAAGTPGLASTGPSPEAVDLLERLSAAIAALAEHVHGYAEVASVLRGLQAQLDQLRAGSLPSARLALLAGTPGRHH